MAEVCVVLRLRSVFRVVCVRVRVMRPSACAMVCH
jgi:hypothetical protein